MCWRSMWLGWINRMQKIKTLLNLCFSGLDLPAGVGPFANQGEDWVKPGEA